VTARPLRAVILGPLGPPFGGPEVMTRMLIDALAKGSWIDFVHLDTQVSGSLAQKGRRPFLKAGRGAVHLLRLVGLIVRFRPNLVYLPLTNSPGVLGFLRDAAAIGIARIARARVAIRLHGGHCFYNDMRGASRAFARTVMARVDVAMVQGSRLTSCFGDLIPADRVAVIPNGIDDAPFAAARARLSPNSGPPQVLFVGLLCREKGFHDVLAAMPQVPGAVFVFLGEWGSDRDRREAEARVKADGTGGRARFPGVVSGDAKYDVFLSSAVLAFPTYFPYEGHSVATVEALATGLPIVCTDHGALSESVRDGWNGFFVPPRDPDALAAGLRRLIGDDSLRRSMGARSRELFEARFRVEQFVEQWVGALSTAIRSPEGDAP
jgi:glycosyltransferase involved in cell wall biosynthesis